MATIYSVVSRLGFSKLVCRRQYCDHYSHSGTETTVVRLYIWRYVHTAPHPEALHARCRHPHSFVLFHKVLCRVYVLMFGQFAGCSCCVVVAVPDTPSGSVCTAVTHDPSESSNSRDDQFKHALHDIRVGHASLEHPSVWRHGC